MTDENNQIKFFLYENWARTKTGQHTVYIRKKHKIEHIVFSARSKYYKKRLKIHGDTGSYEKLRSLINYFAYCLVSRPAKLFG